MLVKLSAVLAALTFYAGVVIAQITGKVVKIADGDTFTILTSDKKQIKIRLHGIDCPEKGQPYGQKAKNYTSALVLDGLYLPSKRI